MMCHTYVVSWLECMHCPGARVLQASWESMQWSRVVLLSNPLDLGSADKTMSVGMYYKCPRNTHGSFTPGSRVWKAVPHPFLEMETSDTQQRHQSSQSVHILICGQGFTHASPVQDNRCSESCLDGPSCATTPHETLVDPAETVCEARKHSNQSSAAFHQNLSNHLNSRVH